MSLNNYSDLQTAISNWLGGRSDLGTFIPDFITLFEAVANRRLLVRQMETTTLLTTTSGVAALPSDYLEWRNVYWNGNSTISLEWVHPTYASAHFTANQSDTPAYFTIEGGNIITFPYDDSAQLSMLYRQKLTPLSTQVNWLFLNHPDCYLWGSLAETGDFTKDDDQLQKWIARRDAVFEEIQLLDKRDGKFGGIRIISPTP